MTSEDYRMLLSLPPAAAREMERLLHNQANGDRQFYAHYDKREDFDVVQARVRGRTNPHGAGGGRARRTLTEPS